MSAVAGSQSARKMPTGSSRRKARVPLHITRQAIIEDGPAMDNEDEEDTGFLDPDIPSTSSKAMCNGMGVGEDSPKVETTKEEPELPEGTIVVQPEAVPDNENDFEGPEFKAKGRTRRSIHKDVISDINRVHCTSCNNQVNHLDTRSFKSHPALKVVLCRKCFDYYSSGKFTQDDDGIDEQCRWCAEGGSLICCDFCCNAFCKKCIKRNLGRSTLSALLSGEGTKWHCYVCDSSPLKQLQQTCKDVTHGIKRLEEAAKARRAHLSHSAASTETSDVEETQGLLHPSISSLSVSLRIKPKAPSLEITQEGLRVLRPQGGDRHGLKMALWMMRSLIQTSEKAEKAIKKQLAAKQGTSKTEKPSGDEVQSDDKKWVMMKIGNGNLKKSTTKQNGQTSLSSKTQDHPSAKPQSDQKSIKKETSPSPADVNGKIASDSSTSEVENKPKVEKDNSGITTPDEQSEEKEQAEIEKADAGLSGQKESSKKSLRTRSSKEKDIEENEETEMDLDQEEKEIEDMETENNEETKEEALEVDKPEGKEDAQQRNDADEDEKKEQEEEEEANAEERSDQDVECEKALMEEISGMASDHSVEEPSTPKMERPDRKHLTSITPLRIKLEKIPPSKLEQSYTKERSKSPRRQKTTPRSSRSSSLKQESDLSENDVEETDTGTSTPRDKQVSKELLDKKEDDSSDDSESSESNESDLEDIDWKSTPRRSSRRQQKESDDGKEKEHKKLKKKKVNKKEKSTEKGGSKDSDSEIDFPKSPIKKNVLKSPKGPGKDSSNMEDDDSEEIERLLTPRKSKTRQSSRLKQTPKSASKSKAKSKSKVRDSDSSNFDSDLERQINNLTKAPKMNQKDRENQEDSEEEDSGPEVKKAEEESDAESNKEKEGKGTSSKKPKKSKKDSDSEDETNNKKPKSKKSKKGNDSSDSSSDSEDEALENDESQVGDDVQRMENVGQQDGGDSDLENKLAEQQLMEEIEAELDKEDADDDEDDEDSSDEDSDSDQPKKKSRGKKKNKTAEDSDDEDEFKAASGEEEEDEDDDEEDDEDEEFSDSDDEKSSKKKPGRRHRLMRIKLGESSSSGDDADASDSGSRKKKKSKRGRKRDQGSRSSSSDSDSVSEKPKKGSKQGRRRKRSSTGSDSSSRDFQKDRSYKRGKGKGKKRRRIKVATDSDSDVQKKKGSGSSEEEKDTPSKHGRKKIRKLISKNRLQEETVRAAKEERERRKRITEKRKQVTEISEEAAETMGTVDEIILESDTKTKKVLLSVEDSLAKQLKPHQVEGVQFMWDCTFESMEKLKEKGSGCILAHCMGLGKTLQVITYLHTIMMNEKISIKNCLVVAPLNTVLNWVSEFEKWLGEDSAIEVFEITSYKNNWQRADALKYWHDNGGVMVMGYSMYRQLAMHKFVKNKKQRAIFTQALVDPGPDIVVCDEGHMLKNDASAISKALNSIGTRRRICLTGTPLQNNLIEYHCMVDFVKPNLLGTRREFLNRFVNPITNGQCADSTPRDVKIMKRRAHVLHDLLNGCVQRKDYSALTKFLPPKHEYVISVRLTDVQIKLYELYLGSQSRNDTGQLIDGSSKGSGTGLFADYQQLMQIWTHPHVLKLSEIRQEKIQARNYMSDFVTSNSESEVCDSSDSIQQFMVDGSDPEEIVIDDGDDDDKPSTSAGIRGTRRTRGMAQQQAMMQEKDMDQQPVRKKAKGSGDSDSSMEIIKTWKTRSRCRDPDGEYITRSPSPNLPTSKPKWYDEYLQEGDDTKIELSGKLVLLFEVLKYAESIGEKLLVFSQSLLSLDLIEDMLHSLEEKAQVEREEGSQDLSEQVGGIGSWVKGEDYFRMDGSTSAAFRKAWAQTFNDMNNYRARLFLISTKAGSLGTNLIGANRVIIFDASWNPSHDIQSIFRVYRFGQTRAVYIYRFVAQGTMEEKIYERQVTKQSLSCRVVDEHQIERHFTSQDLSELYTFNPERLDDPNVPERETPVLPKDYVLAEILKRKDKWIVKYHEHDSLLENIESEELNEEERKNAWKEYEDEKEGRMRMGFDPRMLANQGMNQQDLAQLQNQGIYGAQAAAQLMANPQQRYVMMPGGNMNPSFMMEQQALSAASSNDYQQFQNMIRYQRQLQQMQQLQQQQKQQQQQQQQQQQELARMRSASTMNEIIAQQLMASSKPATAPSSSATSKFVTSAQMQQILQKIGAAKSADKLNQSPFGTGGPWSGIGGGKGGPPGTSSGGTK
ncbi:transcriptional regulator ATRX homolog isoform X2 [Patiria miniata]|uniref:ATP-dependent helicase ATRX n=1 Tax=Patiria miniata TaxID=46514 RepID=A0A913ZZD5_PATMI|nr:transcriptional regulator ATRX homolog isoform X2 [Patiria miniata]